MNTIDRTGFIGIDVGGTSVDGGVVTANGELVGPVQEAASPSAGTFDEAVAAFASVARDARSHAEALGLTVQACGIGMPNPFDHERGISHMEHKFESLLGKDLKTPLEQQLGMPVFFINDADAFGLGVGWKEYPDEERVLCLTLGTGLGSAFVLDGRIQNTAANGVPQDGEVWNLPYKGGILEDKISKKRLIEEYKHRGGIGKADVKHIVEQARDGEAAAVAAAAAYAQGLGEGVAMVSTLFRPTMIVFGGRIAGGLDVFASNFEKAFQRHYGNPVPYSQTQLAHAAIYGAARRAQFALRAS